MSQTGQMVRSLKRCIRAKGLTYKDVASSLGLSESSVKRLFSEQTFSLQRLEDICRFLDMSIYDLSRLAAAKDDDSDKQLSTEQEIALAEDPLLLCYFFLLLIGWKPYRIRQRLSLDELGQTRLLTRLDHLKLIELMPRNQVRLLKDSRITWSTSGPVRARYETQVKREFFDHTFKAVDEVFSLEVGELSDASIKVLMRRIEQLADEFSELTEIDRRLPPESKRSFGVLTGARQWNFWNIVGDLPDMN